MNCTLDFRPDQTSHTQAQISLQRLKQGPEPVLAKIIGYCCVEFEKWVDIYFNHWTSELTSKRLIWTKIKTVQKFIW